MGLHLDDEKQHEQVWMTAVNDTLYVEPDYEKKPTPVMWSASRAARLNTVGHQEKIIDAFLPLFHEKAATPELIRHGKDLVKKITAYFNPHH